MTTLDRLNDAMERLKPVGCEGGLLYMWATVALIRDRLAEDTKGRFNKRLSAMVDELDGAEEILWGLLQDQRAIAPVVPGGEA